jgi:hypothetical protein
MSRAARLLLFSSLPSSTALAACQLPPAAVSLLPATAAAATAYTLSCAVAGYALPLPLLPRLLRISAAWRLTLASPPPGLLLSAAAYASADKQTRAGSRPLVGPLSTCARVCAS